MRLFGERLVCDALLLYIRDSSKLTPVLLSTSVSTSGGLFISLLVLKTILSFLVI